MAKLYLVNDRNKARTWSFQLPNGKVVTLYANRWSESAEDLSEYVRSGFVVCRDTAAVVAAPPAAVPAPVVSPVAAPVPRDPMSAFANALNSAFAKPAPKAVVAEDAPVVAPVPTPVVEVAAPAEEPVITQPIALDDVADDSDVAYASMTRNALWVLATERGLVGTLDYRSTTKTQLVNLLVANLEG